MPDATKRRLRVSVRRLVLAIAVVAAILAGARWCLELTPRVRGYRRQAAIHARSSREWAEYARLSDEHFTSIHKDPRGGAFLRVHEVYPLRRPGPPGEAEAFDRERAEVAAICRARAAYHSALGEKWRRAASSPWPWVAVPPDPPPPMPLAVEEIRDISV